MALVFLNCGEDEGSGGATSLLGQDNSNPPSDGNTTDSGDSDPGSGGESTPSERAIQTSGAFEVPVGDGNASLDYASYGDPDGGFQPLYVHIGGYDVSAAEALTSFVGRLDTITLDALLETYHFVALDRIGVMSASSIDCEWDVDGSSAESELQTEAAAYIQQCQESFSELSEMDTERYAQDVERLRIELGYERLNFLVSGYGAQLALAYAALFPGTRRLMVLEAPADPRLDFSEQVASRSLALERALDGFFGYCDSEPSCPFGGGEDVGSRNTRVAFDRLFGRFASPPESRTAFERTVIFGVEDQRQWPAFATTLADLDSGAATPTEPADPDSGRTDGVLFATACPDGPIDSIEDLRAAQVQIFEGPALFRRELNASLFPCEAWEGPAPAIDWDQALSGLFNVLFVTADGDSVVPKELSDSLIESVSGATRVTSAEFSHGIGLLNENPCVDDAILRFLLDGDTTDTSCSRQ